MNKKFERIAPEIDVKYVARLEQEIEQKKEAIKGQLPLIADPKVRKNYEAAINILAEYKTAKLWLTVHDGKLGGMKSLNSSCRANPYCLARMENGEAVCSNCFAEALLAFRLCLECHMLVNTYILNSRVLTAEDIPDPHYTKKMIAENPNMYLRIESYGDTGTVLQSYNYLTAAETLAEYRVAAWTKNPGIWDKAIKAFGGKPANFRLGLSSLMLNKQQIVPARYVPIIDFVFTVFSKEYLATHHEIQINCGGEHCASCGLCYDGECARVGAEYIPGTQIAIVNEVLRPKKKAIKQIS